jgi:signal transduction histidine kinase
MGHTQEGIERIKSIVDRLRGFSHISDMGFSDANLNDALDNSLTIVWNEIKYRAAVTKNYSTLPLVTCSLGEIEQVFVNLFVNAAHAMSEKGQITLTTAAEGDFVTVTIADTGCGISPKNLSRIFDPFFTTKPVGKGTGLGLWISATIIEKHRGSISVESTPGVGTVFLVRLPVHQTGDSGGGENGNVA